MQRKYLFNTVPNASLEHRAPGASQTWLPTWHHFFWSALGVTCTAAVILSRAVQSLMSMLLKVAWLYMVTGARG